MLDLPERIRERIRISPITGCWLWQGGKFKGGYGSGWWQGRDWQVHRLVWKLLKGRISRKKTLDHLCRRRNCVNPTHMEQVPLRVNILRGNSPTAIKARKVRCKRGHPLSGDNLIKYKDGRRACRKCANAKSRAWKKANPEKVRERHQQYYQKHREEISARRRARRAARRRAA